MDRHREVVEEADLPQQDREWPSPSGHEANVRPPIYEGVVFERRVQAEFHLGKAGHHRLTANAERDAVLLVRKVDPDGVGQPGRREHMPATAIHQAGTAAVSLQQR